MRIYVIAADEPDHLIPSDDLVIEPVTSRMSVGGIPNISIVAVYFDAMVSMVAHPLAITSPTVIRAGDTMMTDTHESPTQRKKKGEVEDRPRGRRRSRTQIKANDTNGNTSEGGDNGNADDGPSSGPDGPSRKRRRSRKGLDKKFECNQEGCTKSYSRAEHLYVTHLCCISSH